MGSGQGTQGRSLRLERETLRDLAPTPAEAAAVRGADDLSMTGKRSCLPLMSESVLRLLGSTMTSYGCRGVVRIERTETGQEIHLDLQPNHATLEMHEIAKQDALNRLPDLGAKLDELGKQRPI